MDESNSNSCIVLIRMKIKPLDARVAKIIPKDVVKITPKDGSVAKKAVTTRSRAAKMLSGATKIMASDASLIKLDPTAAEHVNIITLDPSLIMKALTETDVAMQAAPEVTSTANKKATKAIKQVATKTMETPPANWQRTIENIRKVRQKFPAPVDTMGCDKCHDKADKDINQRFQVLVSLMLSSQTKDPITWGAVKKLKEKGICTIDGILDSSEKDIEDLIHPVGFYRRKAVYLKKVAKILKEEYDGDIPDSINGLCDLPGVGPKMAHLCMMEAWNIVTGIGVDVHVHRISARLGWVPKKGIKTPEDTRIALESWLPREYWREINHLLVGFGQTICTPLRPKCDECYNNVICPSSSSMSGSKKSSPTTEKKSTR